MPNADAVVLPRAAEVFGLDTALLRFVGRWRRPLARHDPGKILLDLAVTAIADYALLGDCQGAALVSRDGSVGWWCPARFDAPSVVTGLLDPEAGHWFIRPQADHEVTRRYVEGSLVVQMGFRTGSGLLRLTEGLALGPGERGHRRHRRSRS